MTVTTEKVFDSPKPLVVVEAEAVAAEAMASSTGHDFPHGDSHPYW